MSRLSSLTLALAALAGFSLQAQTTAQPWTTGTYVYDGAGNIKSIGTDQYRYDGLNRIVTGTAAGGSQSATYDAWGNVRTLTTDGTALTFGVNGATNRLTEQVDPVTGQPYNVFGTYDAAGRLQTMAGIGHSFSYDANDTVMRSTVDGTTEVHLYTASDERIASVTVVNGTETRSDWTLRDASGKVLRRLEKTGTQWAWKEDYIYRGPALLAAEVDTPAQTLHFHADHLGSPRLITANGGMKVALHSYLPFGREITSAAQDSEKIKFAGHEQDASSLYYMHARYYTPNWGRFLSVDPKHYYRALPDAQRWNRYTYALNNPLRLIDPDGREPKAYLIATGKTTDVLRHSAVYIRDTDPARKLDLVYSHGGQASGVSSLREYLSAYNPVKDPTVAYELKMEPSEVLTLKDKLDENYTITNGQYVPEEEYDALSNNCSQVAYGAITEAADLNFVQEFVVAFSDPIFTYQAINNLDLLDLIEEPIPADELKRR